MAEDVSKKTVAILLVIAVVVSVIGTWSAMTQEIVSVGGNNDDNGKAKFKILAPGELPVGTVAEVGNAKLGVK